MRTKIKKSSEARIYTLVKLIFDFFTASIFLITGLPVFLIIALLIKLSSRGPIFFSQERIGKNNIPFKCLKFRTMHPEAEDILENLIMQNNSSEFFWNGQEIIFVGFYTRTFEFCANVGH